MWCTTLYYPNRGEVLFCTQMSQKDAEKFSTYHVPYYEVHKSQFSLTFVLDPREILILILIILSNLFSLPAIFKEESGFFSCYLPQHWYGLKTNDTGRLSLWLAWGSIKTMKGSPCLLPFSWYTELLQLNAFSESWAMSAMLLNELNLLMGHKPVKQFLMWIQL